MIVICGTQVCGTQMMVSPGFFFFSFFQNSVISGFLGGGVKGQKLTHDYQFQFVTLYISRTVDHIIKIFGTQV